MYICGMQFLKKIFDFYIFSNIHVAIAGFCLTKITLLNFGFSSLNSPLFVAFSIIVSYNFIRLYEIKTNRLGWLKDWFLKQKRAISLLSFTSVLGLGYVLLFTDFNSWSLAILLPFAFMTFFYVIPILKLGTLEVSFRNFPGIKIFSIAIAWAGVTVLFPLYEKAILFNTEVYLEFIQRILILLVIIFPFDIRDVKSDAKRLKTLPQVLGVKKTKIIGLVLLILVVLLELIQKTTLIITILIAIITGLFLWFSTEKRSRYYSSFWVEAIPICWFILIMLFLKK